MMAGSNDAPMQTGQMWKGYHEATLKLTNGQTIKMALGKEVASDEEFHLEQLIDRLQQGEAERTDETARLGGDER